MYRTKHLLPLLLLFVASCFQPLFANSSEPATAKAELPIMLASVYEHWEKDLQPFYEPRQDFLSPAPASSSSNESLPYILLSILLISTGVLIVGDASRVSGASLSESGRVSEDT